MMDLPRDFSGLRFAPNKELGVYILMGLLWEHLPYRFALEEFEVDPHVQEYPHRKVLDARGHVWINGQWREASIEFKLFSSDLLLDLQRHPDLQVDFLICWEHDAPEAKEHASHIIALKDILMSLPRELRNRYVLEPGRMVSRDSDPQSLEMILKRFRQTNRPKVEMLLKRWRDVVGDVSAGKAEIKFMRGQRTVMRACAYNTEHLIIRHDSLTSHQIEALRVRFNPSHLQEGSKIFLDALSQRDVEELPVLLAAVSRSTGIE